MEGGAANSLNMLLSCQLIHFEINEAEHVKKDDYIVSTQPSIQFNTSLLSIKLIFINSISFEFYECFRIYVMVCSHIRSDWENWIIEKAILITFFGKYDSLNMTFYTDIFQLNHTFWLTKKEKWCFIRIWSALFRHLRSVQIYIMFYYYNKIHLAHT